MSKVIEQKKRRSFRWTKRVIVGAIAGGLILALAVGGIIGFTTRDHSDIAHDRYQAVFLTNGQVYFGKLEAAGENLKLTDIFYLQKSDTNESTNPQQTTADSGDVQLIKLGSEVHGPQDEMVINRQQVLFYENLKPDSKVSQTIAKYRAGQ